MVLKTKVRSGREMLKKGYSDEYIKDCWGEYLRTGRESKQKERENQFKIFRDVNMIHSMAFYL